MTNLSNSNTSNRNTQANTTQSTCHPKHDPNSFYRMVVGAFCIGDTVLCPSLGLGLKTFTLHKSEYQGLVEIHAHNSTFLYDKDGYFVRADLADQGDNKTLDFTPSLFHDTPANRQAIATLYQCDSDVKVIDMTQADDDEVVKIPSVLLSDIACDAVTALESFNDIANMLYMITSNELKPHQIKALARLAYDSAFKRADTQSDIINKLNKPLAQSKFGTVEVRS